MGKCLEIAVDQSRFPAPTVLQIGKLSDSMGLQADPRGGCREVGCRAKSWWEGGRGSPLEVQLMSLRRRSGKRD